MVNRDILVYIADFIDFDVATIFNLAQVNRLFYQVFTSDSVWQQCNVYGLKNGVYRHFMNSWSQDDKSQWQQFYNFKHHPEQLYQFLGNFITGTRNRYLWLKCFAAEEYIALSYHELTTVPLDRDFLVVGVLFSPSLYLQCTDDDLLNDREIAFNALTSKKGSMFCSAYFSQRSELAKDRDFCKLVVDRPSREIRGNLGYFAPELAEDLDILELAFKWCPQAIFLAPHITREIVDLLVPSEAAFLPVIQGYAHELPRFLGYYRSARVIRTAVNGSTDERDRNVLHQVLLQQRLNLEAHQAIRVYFTPSLFMSMRSEHGLEPTFDTTLMALWSPFNYSERRLDIAIITEIYHEMGPKFQNNKELWYLYARALDSTRAPIRDTLAELVRPSSVTSKSVVAVLDDPNYSDQLAGVGRDWAYMIEVWRDGSW